MEIIYSIGAIAFVLIIVFGFLIHSAIKYTAPVKVNDVIKFKKAIELIEYWGREGLIISMAFGSSANIKKWSVAVMPPEGKPCINMMLYSSDFCEAIKQAEDFINKNNWIPENRAENMGHISSMYFKQN